MRGRRRTAEKGRKIQEGNRGGGGDARRLSLPYLPPLPLFLAIVTIVVSLSPLPFPPPLSLSIQDTIMGVFPKSQLRACVLASPYNPCAGRMHAPVCILTSSCLSVCDSVTLLVSTFSLELALRSSSRDGPQAMQTTDAGSERRTRKTGVPCPEPTQRQRAKQKNKPQNAHAAP